MLVVNALGLVLSGAQRLNNIVFSDDVVIPAVIFAQNGAIFPGYEAAEPFQGSVKGDDGIGFFEHFPDLFAFDVLSIAHHPGEQTTFADGADGFSLPEDG